MDSLSSILGDKFDEPEPISKLKEYISAVYSYDSTIKSGPKGITIIVDSSALANTIRLHLPEIKRQLDISEKLSIRIG